MSLFNKIEMLVLLGQNVSFEACEYPNSFRLVVSEGKKRNEVILPKDHLREQKLVDYITFLQKDLNDTN